MIEILKKSPKNILYSSNFSRKTNNLNQQDNKIQVSVKFLLYYIYPIDDFDNKAKIKSFLNMLST